MVLHDHLDSPDSGIVRDAYGVPVPATYSQVSALICFKIICMTIFIVQPTELEISLTQPIPEEIITRSPARRLDVLPGGFD